MSKKHLKETMKVQKAQKKLVEDKIKDHAKAIKKSLKDNNQKSAMYNRKHMQGHQQEMKKLSKVMGKTQQHLNKVKAM